MSTLTAHPQPAATRIPIGGGLWLDADVATPPDARGVILFAHGSGSSRHSSRNRYVASELNAHRFATVLADLLTPQEEEIDDRTRALRFDIAMLTRRMVQLVDWVKTYDLMTTLPVGLFGASTGAAAALDAAAERPDLVGAVVSRGGRPDLATNLEKVRAPVLLIVGSRDLAVLEMNEDALGRLPGEAKIAIVPGATHLFEERGALEIVASLAADFFTEHLS